LAKRIVEEVDGNVEVKQSAWQVAGLFLDR